MVRLRQRQRPAQQLAAPHLAGHRRQQQRRQWRVLPQLQAQQQQQLQEEALLPVLPLTGSRGTGWHRHSPCCSSRTRNRSSRSHSSRSRSGSAALSVVRQQLLKLLLLKHSPSRMAQEPAGRRRQQQRTQTALLAGPSLLQAASWQQAVLQTQQHQQKQLPYRRMGAAAWQRPSRHPAALSTPRARSRQHQTDQEQHQQTCRPQRPRFLTVQQQQQHQGCRASRRQQRLAAGGPHALQRLQRLRLRRQERLVLPTNRLTQKLRLEQQRRQAQRQHQQGL